MRSNRFIAATVAFAAMMPLAQVASAAAPTVVAPSTLSVGGEGYVCGIQGTGTVRCFGNDLGWGAFAGIDDAVSLDSHGSFTCVLRASGKVICAGVDWASVAAQADQVENAVAISVGGSAACALIRGGDVACWGWNDHHRASLDLGPESGGNDIIVAPRLQGFKNAVQVVQGDEHSCVLFGDSSIRCWGDNSFGQTTVPNDLGSVREISAGGPQTCAILTNGSARCWGWSAITSHMPELSNVSRVVPYMWSTCAVLLSGDLKCWGAEEFTGYRGNSLLPITDLQPPTPIQGVVDVSLGATWWYDGLTEPAACALLRTGAVSCWGGDRFGGLTGARNAGVFTSPSTARLTPSAPLQVLASAGNSSAQVQWLPPLDDGADAVTGFTVKSHPGGLTCTTSSLTCTVNGLTNRQSYTFTVTATNAVGTGESSAPSADVMPLAPGFQAWPNDTVLAVDSSTTLKFAQAAAAASIAVTGSAKATVNADPAGLGSTTFTASKAGIQKFTATYSVKVGKKTTKYTATTQLYVPSVMGPMLRIKQGKTGKFSLQFMPPGTAVVVALTDGRTINLTADSAGKASTTAVFNTRGAVNYTVTVAGVQVATGGLTIS